MGSTTWRGICCTFHLVQHAYERRSKHYPGRRANDKGGYWIVFDYCPDCGKERVISFRDGKADEMPSE